MNRLLTGFAAVSALLLGAPFANAADLPQRPAQTAPYLSPTPVYNWTGCYVGANIGAAWSDASATDLNSGAGTSETNSGVAGGGQIGCDYQMGPMVIGVRNMLDGTSLSGNGSFSSGPLTGFTADSNSDWFDTLTARAGYLVQPNILLYMQGGVAWTRTGQAINNAAGVQVATISNNTTGWTIGGGVEWMFVPQWSAFLEYNYMDFGSNSGSWPGCGGTCNVSVDANVQNVLVGVNYRF